jgi:lysyl-tRNA synthetase class 2
MSKLVAFSARLAALPAGVAVLLAASGWLYIVGPSSSVDGPRVGDALPLDELAKHSAVPLLVFLAVWGCAALTLGCVAWLLRLRRLVAALLLGLLVGAWSYATTAVSILVVRQIDAESAFRDAATLRAVLVPAVLAALAGAMLARGSGQERARSRLVLPWLTAAAGAIGVVDSLLPEHGSTLVAELAPGVRPLTSALVAPFGLALVYVSPGLTRGSRRAWQLALGLLVGSTILHLAHSDYGALVTGGLAAALLACRGDYRVAGDPSARGRIALRGALVITAVLGYGSAALWANRLAADQPFSASFALRETLAAVVGARLVGSEHLSGLFGDWFGPSVFALGLAGMAAVAAAWLAPWRFKLDEDERNRQLGREIVATWGADTLAPFVLRADKSYFFGPGEQSLVAYRVVGGVAVVSGDPLGPPGELDGIVGAFIEYARSRGWRVCILGASEDCLALYRRHGLRFLYHGDEAVVDVAGFSLEGRAIRKVRQSVSRLTAAGYVAEIVCASAVEPALAEELEAIRREWRGDAPDRGYAMAADSLFRLQGDNAVFVIGRSEGGQPQGFLHFAVSRPGRALSLSSMPRVRTTPNGFNEWLVCAAVEWAREHDFQRVSLNFAPFAALLAPEAELSPAQRVQRRALLALKGHFQLDNLLLFNRKFFPLWVKRFVVFEHRRDLPRVGLAALAAESYLPFGGKTS